ncbi:MAG: hypothetical protein KKH34_09035 [Candidatus Omnitrophica bacterium]|nr:hypothetical protein [Candidatus Omnitrophota bacterium]
MVKKPEEYRWTSYRGYIGREKDEYIDRERIKEIMEMSGRSYEEFVAAGIGKEINPFKGLYAGFILGKTRFIKEKLDEIKDQVEGSKEVSYEAEISREFAADDIIRIIEKKYNRKIEQIKGLKKENRLAKKMGIYLLRRYSGLNNREIGERLGMNYSAVSKAGMSIEKEMETDKRVNREVKELLSQFEV